MKQRTSNILSALILAVGTTAMLGEILQLPKVKGLALASQIAPFTKVFGSATSYQDQRKFETFAADFTLHFTDENGSRQHLLISPEVYTKIEGPYNRRNVYGATLAYGPALSPTTRKHLLQQALTSEISILDELGIPQGCHSFTLTVSQKNPQLATQTFQLRP